VLVWAVPPLKATGVPKLVPSTTNWTVPVGVPVPGETTAIVAVKVTLWPLTDGVTEDVTLVVVFALLTVWPPASEPLLATKLPSPPYCAVIVCGLPLTLRDAVLVCAVPPLSAIGLPKFVPSTTNWTVPVGVPAPGEAAPTVAVKVTLSPAVEGFTDEVTPVVVFALFTVWPPDSEPLLVTKLPSPL
jgi:hypothetical protein